MIEIRQTFPHEIALRQHVPEQVRAQYAVQEREFSARDLHREGYSDDAIAAALRIDVKLVRRIIGEEL